MVKDVANLPNSINRAFKISMDKRPGPVLIDLPKDVSASILKEEPKYTTEAIKSITDNNNNNDKDTILKVANLIQNSKSPVIYAGQGMLSSELAPKLLKKISDLLDIPVTTTLLGLGCFDEYDEKSLHMLGMHGSAYANLAIQSSDLVISLGARFDDRVTGNLKGFAPSARYAESQNMGGIIHFDILPKNVNKTVKVTHKVVGDITKSLSNLLTHLKFKKNKQWHDKINEWKTKYPFQISIPKDGKLSGPLVLSQLNHQLQKLQTPYIVTTGVGQHQMWAAQFMRWRQPRSFITSGGLGTMGFGLPSAIGAQIACPDKIVIDIDGDASFQMTAMELITAVQYNIPVKVIILNNQFQGMVMQWQDLFYNSRYSGTKMHNPDFTNLAKAMGCHALYCDNQDNLEKTLNEFLTYDKGPILLETKILKDDHVYPMVPAGKSLHEMVLNKNGDSIQF